MKVVNAEPTRVELLETDMDTRLYELWREFWQGDWEGTWEDGDVVVLGAFMRAAYGRGYTDALKEDTAGERASLCTAHGFKSY